MTTNPPGHRHQWALAAYLPERAIIVTICRTCGAKAFSRDTAQT